MDIPQSSVKSIINKMKKYGTCMETESAKSWPSTQNDQPNKKKTGEGDP